MRKEVTHVSSTIILSNKFSGPTSPRGNSHLYLSHSNNVVGQDTLQKCYGLAHSSWPFIWSVLRSWPCYHSILIPRYISHTYASLSRMYQRVLLEYPQTSEDTLGSILCFSKLYLPVSFKERYECLFLCQNLGGYTTYKTWSCTGLLVGRHVTMSSGLKIQLNEVENPHRQYSTM